MPKRQLVIIESPYAGNTMRNLAYARAAVAHAIGRKETPFASHLLYTQPGILHDDVAEERRLGIEMGYDWWEAASLIAFYTDRGWSTGMLKAWNQAKMLEKRVQYRSLVHLTGTSPQFGQTSLVSPATEQSLLQTFLGPQRDV